VSLHGALDITFVSALDTKLQVVDREPRHSSMLTGCEAPLPPGGQCTLYARREEEAKIGVAGRFSLRCPSEPDVSYSVSYDFPLGARHTASVEVTDPPGYAHALKEEHQGHHATSLFELARRES
jgi:hypothetical protein